MMSVPALNPVLASSGGQPPKVATGPAGPAVTPLGLTVPPPKLSTVIPPSQISGNLSPSRSVPMKQSNFPITLVHENKLPLAQAQSPSKVADKPKDLSPAKPTSNGMEAAAAAKTPSLAPQPPDPVPVNNKTEDNAVAAPAITNHTDETSASSTPAATAAATPAAAQPAEPVQRASSPPPKAEVNDTPGAANSNSPKQAEPVPDTKAAAESPKPEAAAVTKPTKLDPKPQPSTSKRKREPPAVAKKEDTDEEPEKKPRRVRQQVLPYQSPLPELTTIINKTLKVEATPKGGDDRLIVFYKNEFLAVRNAEGGFYLCQALQNVYRASHRIRIRWLSQNKEGSTSDGDIYVPDFYDTTDFECILTTVCLEKLDKNKYKLSKVELDRTENILKRALDVEQGVSEKPSVTEEHPDGIDLSLYRDESQLQTAKKAVKRKSRSPTTKRSKKAKKPPPKPSKPAPPTPPAEPKATKLKSRNITPPRRPAKKKAKPVHKTPSRPERSTARDRSGAKAVDQLKVSPPNEKARVVAKVLRKVDIAPAREPPAKKLAVKPVAKGAKKGAAKSKKPDKTRKAAPAPSPPAPTTTRSSERRGAVSSRKKTGRN